MRRDRIRIGETYWTEFGGRLVQATVSSERDDGSFAAMVHELERHIRVKEPARFKRPVRREERNR